MPRPKLNPKVRVVTERKLKNVLSAEAFELPDIVALFLTEEVNGFAIWKRPRAPYFELTCFLQTDEHIARTAFHMKARILRSKEKQLAKT